MGRKSVGLMYRTDIVLLRGTDVQHCMGWRFSDIELPV